MEKSLFEKHLSFVKKRKNNKEEILSFIKEKTGILLDEKEISLSKKEINLVVSSVKKARLIQKGAPEIIKQKGYTLKG